MTKSETFKAAHAAANRAFAEQLETKHPSARKSYAELFALSLRGCYIKSRPVAVVDKPKFLWLRGL